MATLRKITIQSSEHGALFSLLIMKSQYILKSSKGCSSASLTVLVFSWKLLNYVGDHGVLRVIENVISHSFNISWLQRATARAVTSNENFCSFHIGPGEEDKNKLNFRFFQHVVRLFHYFEN